MIKTKNKKPLSMPLHCKVCRDFVSAADYGKRDAMMEVKRFVCLQCKQKILKRI